MFQCDLCSNFYVWSHDLKRHMKNKHSQQQQQQQQQYDFHNNHILKPQNVTYNGPEYIQQQQDFVFKHPFTANISGPTSCGKTYFVKTLLENCLTKISPPPQRIVWLYKRWQPLYDVIKTKVIPTVEFIQGVPLDLDHDTFINPNTRNLIILDDLMSTVSKDPRINELFTEGSHHRNLSVIAINQNLYYNKDPTQRRNCHYLVIFNNPVDKQQVMTLARQMYPEKPQHLMRYFKEYTSKPFGFLLIDLKPSTLESQRLRGEIFTAKTLKGNKTLNIDQSGEDISTVRTYSQQQQQQQQQESVIKGNSSFNAVQSGEDIPSVRTYSQQQQQQQESVIKGNSSFNAIQSGEDIPSVRTYSQQQQQQQQQQLYQDKEEMPSCDDCGLVFENMHDLQRHVKRWCPENVTFKRKHDLDDDESPRKKARLVSDTNDDDAEEEYFNEVHTKVKADNADEWTEKYEKYRESGMSEEDAEDKADQKMAEVDVMRFLELYGRTIHNMLRLRHGKLHKKIMETVGKFLKEGYEELKAIRMSLRKYKHQLREYMNAEDDESDEDDSEEEEVDENEDDDDNESDEESE